MMNKIERTLGAEVDFEAGKRNRSAGRGRIAGLALILMAVATVLGAPAAHAQTPSDLDTLRIESVLGVNPGDTFLVNLFLRNIDTVGAFNLRFRFDTTIIEPLTDTSGTNISVLWQPGDRSLDAFNVNNAGILEQGVIGWAAADLQGDQIWYTPGRGVFVRLQFRAFPSATAQTTLLTIENDPQFPASFNTMSDIRGLAFIRPVLVSGSVTIGGGIDTTDPGPQNDPPSIPVLASPLSVNQGDLLSFPVNATDPEGDSLSLLAFNLPPGGTFTPANPVLGKALASGTFRWTPAFGQSGSFVVSFEATDSAGLSSGVRNVTINVTEVPTDLLFTTSAPGQDPRGGVPGATGVIIPISLSSVQASYGVQFDFVYDPTVFTATALQSTDRLVGFSLYEDLGAVPGRLRVVTFSLDGSPIGAGTTPVLFNVIGNIVPGALPGAYELLFEEAWESINPDPTVSSVALSSTSGMVYVDNLGDANVDTRIDVGDIVAIVGYILGNFTFTGRQFGAADVTANDTLDVFDLVTIINSIFGVPLNQGTPSGTATASVKFVYDANDGVYGAYRLSADIPVDAAGVQVEIRYDPRQTGFSGIEQLADASGLNFKWRDDGNGRLVALLFNGSDTESRIRSGGAEVLRIPLASAPQGAPPVRLHDLKLADPDARRIEVAGFGGLPRSFTLAQNYPNPFNAGTVLPFTIRESVLGASTNTRLEIFNVLGQNVATLHDGPLAAGRYQYEWDGTDGSGQPVASGLYFYRLTTGDQSQTRKMVLLK